MDWNSFGRYLLELGKALGIRILVAIFVYIVGRKVIKWLKKKINSSAKDHAPGEQGAHLFLAGFAGIALNVMLFITIAMILGIPATSFIAAIASCGVAIGLAMQGFLSNFAGGIMILIFKPFQIGDYIETPDTSGTVSEISVVYTILKTPDNKVITIPNGNLTNSIIQNYSAVDRRRVDMVFNTSYDSDVEQVKKILMDVVKKHPQVMQDPEPFARLSAHGESSLSFTVRAWCKTEDYWSVKFDLMEEVKKEFDSNGIAIPYPQMDVHIDRKR